MKRIFELYFGWLFVNGRKQEEWYRYLRIKYGKNNFKKKNKMKNKLEKDNTISSLVGFGILCFILVIAMVLLIFF